VSDQSLALLFPGQGCQHVGMGAQLYQSSPAAKDVYDRADDVLGFPLSEICFAGPADALTDTANAQPAIFVTSIALWRAMAPQIAAAKSRISSLAGHSLGEFSALAAAGAIAFEDGVRLVRRRGEAMQRAGLESPGGMAAILGLSDDAVRDIVGDVVGDLWVANLNCPGQVVIAGSREALDAAIGLAKDRGAKKAVPLAVSVACHTPYMAAAADDLAEALEDTEFRRPWAAVVSNAEARALSEPADIKAALLKQLTMPVRWSESIKEMLGSGVGSFVEIGPKPIVTGFTRRIDRSVRSKSVADLKGIQGLDMSEL